MKTVEVTLYSFDELSEDAKEKALDELHDINVNYDWYNFVYDHAKEIGLEIISFNMDEYCEAKPILAAAEIAQNILNNHGETCDTYKTASEFLEKHDEIYSEYLNEDSELYESPEAEKELIDIEANFLHNLSEDYRIILRNEFEYLLSQEAIIETIQINGYQFLENGTMRNF